MIKFKKFTPLLNRVLIEKIELAQKSKGGIILDSGKSQQIGKVKAAGPGAFKEKTFVKNCLQEGDIVLLPEYGGSSFKLSDGIEYSIYKDDDILGILTEEEN